jgi:hypothetical protein
LVRYKKSYRYSDSQGEGEKKEKEKRSLSPYARAFKMFKDGKPLADAAIELDIKIDLIKFSLRLSKTRTNG